MIERLSIHTYNMKLRRERKDGEYALWMVLEVRE